jgi:GH35 family endo-1,4-beta-xylanase
MKPVRQRRLSAVLDRVNLTMTTHHLDQAIRQQRTTNATVTLTHHGSPLAGQDVVVRQLKHRFLFGGNWGESSIALSNGELTGKEKEQAERRNEQFLQLFNQVTLPFYWGRFEPQRGQPDTQRILNTARWYQAQGCVVKGHPLCWHTITADWLLPLSNREILQAQSARIERDVADFAGIIDMWDVINEAVIMPIFDRYDNGITRICRELGRIELIRTMFGTARAANPNAILLLNDFDVSPAYDILVEGCLEAGIPIDVIGIQSHMHQGYWGVERTQHVLEQFARFKRPIHFTENTLVSGHLMPPEIVDLNDYQVSDWPSTPEGEVRQAREVVVHYKTLMAHPLVEAITWWDLSDGGWLSAPAGLLRQDHSPKPAYDELLKLVKGEWWLAPTKLTTDANGQFSFTGFLGEYELALGKQPTTFSLTEKGQSPVSVHLE